MNHKGEERYEKEKKEMSGTIKKVMNRFGKNQWLIILLSGVLLMVIALPTNQEQTEQPKEEVPQQVTDSDRWGDYEKQVESQLEEALSMVEGVGKVRVLVTLAGTGEIVVEKDVPQTQSQVQEEDKSGGTRTTKENSWQESTVYTEKDGGSTPYVIKELAPEIEGVCVIAQGGGNSAVVAEVSEAVQALFPVEVHKIKVMKMK